MYPRFSSGLGKPCRIDLYLSQNPTEKLEFRHANHQNIFIQSNTNYQAFCITDEHVRNSSFISLNNAANHPMYKISNLTRMNENRIYFMQAPLRVNEEMIGNGSFYLFCRFLTVNPSIYCEKSLNFNVYSTKRQTITILSVIVSTVIVILVLSFLLRFYLNRKNKHNRDSSPNNQHSKKRNSSFRRSQSFKNQPTTRSTMI